MAGVVERRAALRTAGLGLTSLALPTAALASSSTGTVLGSSIRSLLSGPGQAAYDGAGEGDFFVVSSADYAAVVGGLEGAGIRGLNEGELATVMTSNDRFAADAATLPTQIGRVEAGTTIIGYARRIHWSTTITSGLLVAPELLGDYARVGSLTSHAASDEIVRLLRRGGAPQVTTGYLAMLHPTYTLNGASDFRTNGDGTYYAFTASADLVTPPWYAFGSELPMMQVLIHTP